MVGSFSRQGTVSKLAVMFDRGDIPVLVQQALFLEDRGIQNDFRAEQGGLITIASETGLSFLNTLNGFNLTFADLGFHVLITDIDVLSLLGAQFMIGDIRCLGGTIARPPDSIRCRALEYRRIRAEMEKNHFAVTARVLDTGWVQPGDMVRIVQSS